MPKNSDKFYYHPEPKEKEGMLDVLLEKARKNQKKIIFGEMLLLAAGYFGYFHTKEKEGSKQVAEMAAQSLHRQDKKNKEEIESETVKIHREIILRWIEEVDPLTDTERHDLGVMVDRLILEFGELEVGELFFRHKELQKLKLSMPSEPQVEGFKKLGVDSTILADLLRDPKTFPKGTVRGNITKIFFINKVIRDVPKIEGRSDQQQVLAAEFTSFEREIPFYKSSLTALNMSNYQTWAENGLMADTLLHEIGHGNDWARALDLSLKQRYIFWYQALLAYENGTFTDLSNTINEYARKIYHNDKKKQKSLRVVEYWAEMFCAQMSYQDLMNERATPAERNLTKKWVARNEPGFDFAASVGARENYFREITKKAKLRGKTTPLKF